MGDIPLLVSSDVIESLFGKFKTIIQRNPQAELNRLIYIIPLLCGTHNFTKPSTKNRDRGKAPNRLNFYTLVRRWQKAHALA